MKTRHYAVLQSILGVTVLAGCGASPNATEETGSASSALSLPADANWGAGFSPDAVVIGKDSDGAPLYSCRMAFAESIAPGKTRADWTTCDIGYGGAQQAATTYQTLTPVWTSSTYGQVPSTAIPYGVENGQPLYVCRALTPSFQWQVGKVGNGIPGCDYPYNGVEVTAPSYEVLANKFSFDIGLQSVAQGAPLPYNAIRGGTDTGGAAIYPCIAPYNGDLHPGKTLAGWGTCDISYAGREIWVANSYQVLVPQLTAPPVANGVTEYVGGTDSDGASLGVCAVPYGTGMQVGKWVWGSACDFPYGGQEVILSAGAQLLEFHLDTSPIGENFNITLPSGTALGGSANLRLNDDGSYVFSGTVHDSGAVSYNESTLAVIQTTSGVAFTFARNGSSKGTIDCPIFSGCPGRDDTWSFSGTNPGIAQHWADLKKGFSASQTTSVTLNWSQLWTDAQAAYGDAQQVIAVVGPLLPLL